jgi:hypothetical protein
MIVPLSLIELDSLLVCGSILLIQYLDRIALVGQVRLQWNVVFNCHVCWGLQTSFELVQMEYVVHTGQS